MAWLEVMKRFLSQHRRSLAIAGSLILHGIIIFALLRPASGAFSTLDVRPMGTADQKGIDLDLVQPVAPSPKIAHPSQNATQAFTAMTEQTDDNGWKASAPKPASNLADVFGKDPFAQSPPAAQTTKQSATDSHVLIKDRTNVSINDLWKAIEPCWRRAADKNTLAVTLSVSFSPLGNLAKPPAIIRNPGVRLSEQQLRSESLAINALAQCGPYLMAFGQNDVNVQFPAGG